MPEPSRPLRVLHVGNVANNAYLNARLLAAAGVDSDVLQFGHYHIMGCPEWEDSDFRGGPVDEGRPDWRRVDLAGFGRPRWFAHGPFPAAAAYLEARRDGRWSARWRWQWLEFRRDLICGDRWAPFREARQVLRGQAPAAAPASAPAGAHEPAPAAGAHASLIARFRAAFPGRPDTLTAPDVDGVGRAQGFAAASLRRLFSRYDVVCAYGAEPVLPLIAGHHPYVAFEHGTIRALPFTDSALGRLTALAYREADAVLITNADNRAAAERLGVARYRFVPHPVNEYRPDPAQVATLRAELRGRLDADFLVFHPSRQHWSPSRDPHLEKGNDRLIDGLALFLRDRPRAAAVFVAWGQAVGESRARLSALGIAHRVLWIDPVPGPGLARYMSACEVVADQFYLGSFGAVTPRALFLGRPTLLHLDVDAHRWCFPEPAPVLNADLGSAIAAQLERARADPSWLADVGRKGKAWYARYHSNEVVRETLIETYSTVAGRTPSDRLTIFSESHRD